MVSEEGIGEEDRAGHGINRMIRRIEIRFGCIEQAEMNITGNLLPYHVQRVCVHWMLRLMEGAQVLP